MSVTCPYCNQAAIYVDSSEVYNGRSYGMIYLCHPCKAWVGVHKGTNTPLGRLANKELREWKIKAHAVFDTIWQQNLEKYKSKQKKRKKHWVRNSAYAWLAEQMGIPVEACHIGMFDIEQCKRVVEICSPYLRRAA